jgi:peptidoglycan/xylan/chitin deacetylase (PgdA/CDA1 family)
MKQSWHPSWLLTISFVIHVLGFVGMLVIPQVWLWFLAIVVLDHIFVVLVGLWPRSTWLGRNWTHLPSAAIERNEIALTIDDGPNPQVTPHVLDILDQYQVKATFFCIGENAARYPDLCRDIVRRGHAVENHSQRHPLNFSLFSMKRIKREINQAQHTLSQITGKTPIFFRAPAGLRNVFLDPVLTQNHMMLASWTARAFDTRVGDALKVRQKLEKHVKPGAILLLHDQNSAMTKSGKAVILEVLPHLIQSAQKANLHFVTLKQAML